MLCHRTLDMSINSSNDLRRMQPSLGWNKQTVRLSHSNSIEKQKPVFSQNYSGGFIEYYVSAEESHKPTNFPWLPVPFSHSLFLKNQRHGANFFPNSPCLTIPCLVLLLKTFQPFIYYTSNKHIVHFRRKSEQHLLGYVPTFLSHYLFCSYNDYL